MFCLLSIMDVTQVVRHAEDKMGRLFLHGPELNSCPPVKQHLYLAGICKLSDSAIKLYITDSKPGSSTGAANGQAPAAAAADGQAASTAADGELDICDLADDDDPEDAYGTTASDLAAQDAAEEEAEQAAEQAAAQTSAAAIGFETLKATGMFQVVS